MNMQTNGARGKSPDHVGILQLLTFLLTQCPPHQPPSFASLPRPTPLPDLPCWIWARGKSPTLWTNSSFWPPSIRSTTRYTTRKPPAHERGFRDMELAVPITTKVSSGRTEKLHTHTLKTYTVTTTTKYTELETRNRINKAVSLGLGKRLSSPNDKGQHNW